MVTLAWLLCGAMLLLLIFFVNADEQAVQTRIRESLLARSNVVVSDGFNTGATAAAAAAGGGESSNAGGGESSSAAKSKEEQEAQAEGVSRRHTALSLAHVMRHERGYQSMPQLEYEEQQQETPVRGGGGGASSQDAIGNPLHTRLIPFPPTTLNKPLVSRPRKGKGSPTIPQDTRADKKDEENVI